MTEYTETTELIIPDELVKPRYVQSSDISRAEMKAMCERLGIVWGCDLLQ